MVKRLVRRADAVAPVSGWLLVAAAYLCSVGHTLLRYRQWGPDARYYLAWAYRYGGLSEREAAQRTYEFLGSFSWFRAFCQSDAGDCWPDDLANGYDPLFHGFTGGLVAPRVLYPLLSAPFVRLLGPQGMLVVPFVAFAVTVVLTVVLASRLVGRTWAVLAGVAVLLPASMARWSTYAYTEALAMALAMACLVVLPLGRQATRRDLALFGVFLTLFAFTRQFHPVILAAVTLAWVGAAVWPSASQPRHADGRGTALARRLAGRLRNEWLPFVGVAAGVTLLTAVVQKLMSQTYSLAEWFLTQSGAQTWAGVPAALPGLLSRLIRAEGWWITGDYALVLLLLVATVGMVRWVRTPLAQLTIGLMLGTAVLHVLNTQPSNFRYYANAMPLLAVLATAVLAQLLGSRPPAFAAATQPAATSSAAVPVASGLTSLRKPARHRPAEPATAGTGGGEAESTAGDKAARRGDDEAAGSRTNDQAASRTNPDRGHARAATTP